MTEWVEIKARTVDLAKDEALDRLGVALDEAEFEILQEPESKLFGLKKTEARVRARVRPRPPRPKAERRPRKNSGGSGGGNNRNRGGNRGGNRSGGGGNNRSGGGNQGGGNNRNRGGNQNSGNQGGGNRGGNQNSGNQGGNRQAAAAGAAGAAVVGGAAAVAGSQDSGNQDSGNQNSGDQGASNQNSGNQRNRGNQGNDRQSKNQRGNRQSKEQQVTEEVPVAEQQASVQNFLEGTLDGFGLQGTVSSEVDADDILQGKVDGDNLGLLVGPKGVTLRALQELARAAMQRTADGRGTHRLMIDVGGYRERRKIALRAFVQKQATAVVDDGKRVVLEPMGSADRKIIHDAAGEIDGVGSISEGEEPRRRVVLVPAE